MPLIGSKMERLFARQLRQALDADHAFTLQYQQYQQYLRPLV